MAEFTKVCRFLRHRKREDLAELLANAGATDNLLDVGFRGEEAIPIGEVTLWFPASAEISVQGLTSDDKGVIWEALARIHRCGAALGLEQGVRAVGRDGPRSIPINGAGGGPGQRRWGGVGGTVCRGRQWRTGPVRRCGAVG